MLVIEPVFCFMQISDTVYPMYKAYIEPDLKDAQLRIFNTFNPFSGFMNATYILKSAKPVSEEQVKAVLQVRSLLLCFQLTLFTVLTAPCVAVGPSIWHGPTQKATYMKNGNWDMRYI